MTRRIPRRLQRWTNRFMSCRSFETPARHIVLPTCVARRPLSAINSSGLLALLWNHSKAQKACVMIGLSFFSFPKTRAIQSMLRWSSRLLQSSGLVCSWTVRALRLLQRLESEARVGDGAVRRRSQSLQHGKVSEKGYINYHVRIQDPFLFILNLFSNLKGCGIRPMLAPSSKLRNDEIMNAVVALDCKKLSRMRMASPDLRLACSTMRPEHSDPRHDP
jgi:hypothetical protein